MCRYKVSRLQSVGGEPALPNRFRAELFPDFAGFSEIFGIAGSLKRARIHPEESRIAAGRAVQCGHQAFMVERRHSAAHGDQLFQQRKLVRGAALALGNGCADGLENPAVSRVLRRMRDRDPPKLCAIPKDSRWCGRQERPRPV